MTMETIGLVGDGLASLLYVFSSMQVQTIMSGYLIALYLLTPKSPLSLRGTNGISGRYL